MLVPIHLSDALNLPGGDGELRKEGEVWRVAFGGPTFDLPDSKGLQQLAELLAHPGTEFEARHLASLAGEQTEAAEVGDGSGQRARVNVTRTIRGALRKITDQSPALGLYLRATIRTGYRCAYLPNPQDRSARERR